MPTSTETQVLRVGPETPDGLRMGVAATDLIAFYGATPVAQRASGSGAAASSTASTTTTPWGYATSTQANAIVTLVNEIRATMVGLGLMVGT